MPNFDARHAPDDLKEVSYATSDGSIRTMKPNDNGLLVPKSDADEQVLDSLGYKRVTSAAAKPKKSAKPKSAKRSGKAAAPKASTKSDADVTASEDSKLAETKGSVDASE